MNRAIDPHFRPEQIDQSAFVAADVTVRGDVHVGADSSLWFGAVVRGDTEMVEIGARCNVQDLSVIHSDPGYPCRIGDGVTIGHGAIVHGAIVADGAMIGIRAVVLNGAKIGAGSLIAAGALVSEGTEIPPNSLAMGIPAKVVRELNSNDRARVEHAANHYVEAAKVYRQTDSPKRTE